MAVQSEFGYNHFSLENRLDDLQVGISKYFLSPSLTVGAE